jgi:hypothetical protein
MFCVHMDNKQCTKCQTFKPQDDYHFVKARDAYTARCKECIRADNNARSAANYERYEAKRKEWRGANRQHVTQNTRNWQLRNPEKHKAGSIKSTYGVDFEALWAKQEGLCASCCLPMQKGGKETDSVCVDHDRSCCPGKRSCGKCVRGLIHRNCNLVLGYAKDDLHVLRSAIAYLERWHILSSGEHVNPSVPTV